MPDAPTFIGGKCHFRAVLPHCTRTLLISADDIAINISPEYGGTLWISAE
jgi:hypothetical protein